MDLHCLADNVVYSNAQVGPQHSDGKESLQEIKLRRPEESSIVLTCCGFDEFDLAPQETLGSSMVLLLLIVCVD